MATNSPSGGEVCPTCGARLAADGSCPACLPGLQTDATVAAEPSSSSAPSTSPATVFGDFEIARHDDGSLWELGRGAMGVTYRAVDRVLNRPVALKVIQVAGGSSGSQSEDIRERFLREARAAAALRHANVAGVFHFGASDETAHCYYAMELVEGETLEARVRRDGPLDVDTALEIASQVTAALVAAAGRGLIHRDLKPSNLMLTTGVSSRELEVKVIDFGLAKMAASLGETDLTHGAFVGTPAFASPEQFAPQGVDTRSDLYSLGVTLWYALTGRTPFKGKTIRELRDHPARTDLPVEQLKARHVPPSVVTLLRSMLAVIPDERPASARELLSALDTCRRQLASHPGVRMATAGKPLAVFAVLAALLAMAAGGVWWALAKPAVVPHLASSPGNLSSPATHPLPNKSLAVLPFQPLVAEHRDQALELGMADALITKLSNARVVVRSLTSVRKYDNLEQNPQLAGRELEVESVLEGNVQKLGDRIRVTARLINVSDGLALWTDTFDEGFTDVFTVQDAISRKVVDALALRLSGEDRQRLARRETQNVEAYQLYLLGRYHFSKLNPAEIRTSIGLFQQAIALDSQYALAYAGLAEAYRAVTITGDQLPSEYLPQAKEAAMKALAIDESLADPHATLAFIHFWFDWDWAQAEHEAKRAIELNVNSSFAHFAYAHLLALLGRHEEAMAEGATAVRLDPASLMITTLDGSFLFYAGRDEEARTRLRKTLELDPNFWIAHHFLAKILVQEGKYAEALAEVAQAREFSHGNSLTISVGGYATAVAGDSTRARAVLEELKALSGRRYIPPTTIALVYDGLGERDEAFAWLEKAFQEKDLHLSFLKCDPQWHSLRADPRFAALLQRIGLPR